MVPVTGYIDIEVVQERDHVFSFQEGGLQGR
jgi:hypothetical protein